MKARRIDHISIAVKKLDNACKIYENTFGLGPAVEYVAEDEKIKVARYYIGEVALELMEATSPDSEVAKFIQKRGEGVFLISYAVDDVPRSLEELNDKGLKTIDKEPSHLFGSRYAFIMPPDETCGVLTEIIDGDFNPKKK